jgi:hypothetical protein
MQRYPGSTRTSAVSGTGTAPILPYPCFIGLRWLHSKHCLSPLFQLATNFHDLNYIKANLKEQQLLQRCTISKVKSFLNSLLRHYSVAINNTTYGLKYVHIGGKGSPTFWSAEIGLNSYATQTNTKQPTKFFMISPNTPLKYSDIVKQPTRQHHVPAEVCNRPKIGLIDWEYRQNKPIFSGHLEKEKINK